jgi:hypothetical protein
MRFWDASAIVPLLIAEVSTRRLQALAARDPDMLVWWASEVECASALARLERNAMLDPQAAVFAFSRLKQFAAGWHEVDPSDMIRGTAVRLLRVHQTIASPALPRRRDFPSSISPRTKTAAGDDSRAAAVLPPLSLAVSG